MGDRSQIENEDGLHSETGRSRSGCSEVEAVTTRVVLLSHRLRWFGGGCGVGGYGNGRGDTDGAIHSTGHRNCTSHRAFMRFINGKIVSHIKFRRSRATGERQSGRSFAHLFTTNCPPVSYSLPTIRANFNWWTPIHLCVGDLRERSSYSTTVVVRNSPGSYLENMGSTVDRVMECVSGRHTVPGSVILRTWPSCGRF